MVLQPDNPPGTAGDFRLFTSTGATVTGPFSIDFTFKGSGSPGSQPFFLNQYNVDGMLQSSTLLGTTTASTQPGVPEPASFSLGCVALVVGGVFLKFRRRSSSTA